jgi:hypothetical protein
MKASALQEFLRSLGGSLVAVGVSPKSLEDLRAVASALEPFTDLDLEQLADFLRRAAEHRRTGDVPTVVTPGVEDATTAARGLTEAVLALTAADENVAKQAESRLDHGKHDLRAALTKIAGEFGITAKFAENKKWLPALHAKAAVSRVVEEMRRLRPLITETASYQTEGVETAIGKLASVDPKVLKAAATDLNASAKGRGKQFVESLLANLTGIAVKPVRARQRAESKPAATDEQVDAMVKSLQDMVERAKDPKAVSDEEIEALLARVGSEFSALQQKAIAARVTGKGGKSTADSIARLRTDLTAVKRLLESQNV